MRVKYFADIRKLSGREQQELDGTAPTLRRLLEDLARQHGAAFRARVFEGEGRMSGTLIVLVNGRNVEHLEGVETRLAPDDVVAIFPMVAGG